MKRLSKYLAKYKKECVLAPMFKMFEALMDLFVPLVVAAMVDTGISSGDMGYCMRMCLLMVGLALAGLAFSVTAQYFSAKAAVGFAADVRGALFSHIQSFSYSELDTLGTSTMITRLTSDINQMQNGVNIALRLFLRSPFIVFGSMIMAFTIDVKAALVFAVAIPLLAVVVFGIMVITMPLYKKVQARLDGVLTITRENLTGARVLRAFGKEEEEKARFTDRNAELTKMQVYTGRISALTNPLTYLIINLAAVVLIWTGALRVNIGALTQGQVIALVNYMSQILVELIKLANCIVTTSKAIACAGRVADVMDIKSSMDISAAAYAGTDKAVQAGKGGSVVFKNVSLTYKNAGASSLTDIDLWAAPGQTIGVIGGTGSGKSSLVNLIPRFYDATEGEVLVDGRNVRDYSLEELRGRIGVVPQKAVLFKGSIADNLRWGSADATDEELWQALDVAQASEFVRRLPDGLASSVLQGGKNFSGGQRQRLTIARALVRKPEILILDDSSSALDYATDAKLRAAIAGMKDGPTLFIVSQRASAVQNADKIIVLEDGEAVGLGVHSELLKTCPVYREIYDSQFTIDRDAVPGKEAAV